MITDEDKERVRQATDIVALIGETVELRQRGQEFWGCCPFHGEKTPSFKVNPATGLWHCFGCGQGGDVFSYVQKRENLEFPDAIRYLADRAGIELQEERDASRGPKRNRLIDCLTETESFYAMMLMRGKTAGEARKYLSGRGFGSDVCRRWKLGYAPGRGSLVAHLREKGFSVQEMVAADVATQRGGRVQDRFWDRVMFPIHDERGRTIAFGGRYIVKRENTGKYLNTRDTAVFNKRKHLFAYDRAKDGMAATGKAIVCEGYTDVIAMHEAGFTNAVAALGTAFGIDHVRLMERQRVREIVCMFDGDEAGQRAAERAVQFIDKTEAALTCVVLPGGQDPMEFLASHTREEMAAQIGAARPLMDFVFEKRLAAADLSTPGRRVKVLEDMCKVLAPLKDSVLLGEYATRLADGLGLDADEVARRIKATPVARDDAQGDGRSGSWGDDRGGSRGAGRPGSGSWQSRQATPAAPQRGGGPSGGWDALPAEAYDYSAGYDDGSLSAGYLPPEAEGQGVVTATAPAAPQGSWGAAGSAGGSWAAQGGAGGSSFSTALSADERVQVASERELLCAMATRMGDVRPYEDRIAGLSWADGRHEAMAWAMLAAPEGSTPAQLVAAATAVVPEAPGILSGGRAADAGGEGKLVGLLVDTVELYSCKRQVRQIRAKMRGATGEAADGLFERAIELKRRVNELSQKVSGVESD